MKTSLLIIILGIISIRGLGQKIEYTLSTTGDTTKNYYVTIFPKHKVRGSIILLPGFGELPKQTLAEWDIHKYASEAGYLTIIPALGDWSFFYIDETSHKELNKFLEEIFSKYDLEDKPFLSVDTPWAVQWLFNTPSELI